MCTFLQNKQQQRMKTILLKKACILNAYPDLYKGIISVKEQIMVGNSFFLRGSFI